MTILVTGGGGFVGINLAEELIGRGKRIVLFDRHGLPEPALRLLRARDPALGGEAGGEGARAGAGVMVLFSGGVVVYPPAAPFPPAAAREAREPGAIVDVNVL